MTSDLVPRPRFSLETAGVWAFSLALVLALLILVPVGAIPFFATKAVVLALGIILALALFILARLSKGAIALPPLLLVGALWLPALAYALSSAFSGAPLARAVFGTFFESDTLGLMMLASLAATLAALLLRRGKDYRLFLLVLSAGVLLITVVELGFLIVGQAAPGLVSPAASVVGSFSDLGRLMGLFLIGLLLALRLLPLSVRFRLLALAVGAVALVFLALANSSLTWVLVALVSLALFVEAVMRRAPASSESEVAGPASEARPLVPPLIVLVVSLFFVIDASAGTAFANLLHVSVLDARPSWQATLMVGERAFTSSPLFGSGPGSFTGDWLAARDPALNQTPFWNIDFTSGVGVIPTAFVTTGILGALAWLALLGLFLYVGVRALIVRAPEDPFIRFVSVGSFVSALYLFALMIFSVPVAALIILAFSFAGLFVSTLRYGPTFAERGIAFSKSPRIGFVIVFVLTLLLLASVVAGYVVIVRYAAQVALASAENALVAGDASGAVPAAETSVSLAPSIGAYRALAEGQRLRLGEVARDSSLSANEAARQFQAALAAGINAALAASALAPDDYQSWVTLGNLYASVVPLGISGAYENATTAYAKAAGLNPTAPSIPYLQAQLAIAKKDATAAETFLAQAIALKPDYIAALFLLSQTEVASGKVKEALASAENAVYFSPSDPVLLFQVGILRAASNNLDGAITALSAAVAANPSYANARYFLAVAYAEKKDYEDAVKQLEAVAALSSDNASAVASALAALRSGENPFPASLLSAAPPAAISGE